MVVGAGELTAELAAATELEPVLAAASVGVAGAGAGVLEAGVNTGVVAVQSGQMVMVSVVRNVDTLVTVTTA